MCSGFTDISALSLGRCAPSGVVRIYQSNPSLLLQYINVCMHVCMYGHTNACIHACMYACIYVHSYVVCMYVCVYICMYVTVCMYICISYFKFLYANPICFHNCCLRMISVQCPFRHPAIKSLKGYIHVP